MIIEDIFEIFSILNLKLTSDVLEASRLKKVSLKVCYAHVHSANDQLVVFYIGWEYWDYILFEYKYPESNNLIHDQVAIIVISAKKVYVRGL